MFSYHLRHYCDPMNVNECNDALCACGGYRIYEEISKETRAMPDRDELPDDDLGRWLGVFARMLHGT